MQATSLAEGERSEGLTRRTTSNAEHQHPFVVLETGLHHRPTVVYHELCRQELGLAVLNYQSQSQPVFAARVGTSFIRQHTLVLAGHVEVLRRTARDRQLVLLQKRKARKRLKRLSFELWA